MLGSQVSDPVRAFGEVLRAARHAAGMSQEALALDAGMERNFVSLIETGRNQPTITTIFKLARALGLSPGELVLETEARLAGK